MNPLAAGADRLGDEALTGDISSGSGVENDFPAPGLARRTTETKKV